MLEIVANYHCMQFQGKLMNQTWEIAKNLVLDPILAHLAQIRATKFFFINLALPIFFFKNLAPPVTRYYSQLSHVQYQKKLTIQS